MDEYQRIVKDHKLEDSRIVEKQLTYSKVAELRSFARDLEFLFWEEYQYILRL